MRSGPDEPLRRDTRGARRRARDRWLRGADVVGLAQGRGWGAPRAVRCSRQRSLQWLPHVARTIRDPRHLPVVRDERHPHDGLFYLHRRTVRTVNELRGVAPKFAFESELQSLNLNY